LDKYDSQPSPFDKLRAVPPGLKSEAAVLTQSLQPLRYGFPMVTANFFVTIPHPL
jgi:hypothetical protein